MTDLAFKQNIFRWDVRVFNVDLDSSSFVAVDFGFAMWAFSDHEGFQKT